MKISKKIMFKALVMALAVSLAIIAAAPSAAVYAADDPLITYFRPDTGGTGTSVIIMGRNFTDVTSVSFGGSESASFQVNSKNRITAVVGSGSTGIISVTTAGGATASASEFTYIPPPEISSFSPESGVMRTSVVITGNNFDGASKVEFGGTRAASFKVDSDEQITAVVSRGSTGPVSVTTRGGTTASGDSFTYYSTPRVASFSPMYGGTGSVITITGTGLSGITDVDFGGTPALFNIISDNRIEATVGSGSSGNITVSNPVNSSTSRASFTFVGTPSISSFSPDSGIIRTSVIITGNNFGGATKVEFGGTRAASFKVDSDTQITAVVSRGSSGPVAVTTRGGTAVSEDSFTYYSTPRVASFSPRSGGTGSVITITGTGLSGITDVDFGGTPALFNIISDSRIEAIVGSGSTGRITVSNPGGSSTSGATFTFVGTPSIGSFSPESGVMRTSVVITGNNLNGATRVEFGGTRAAYFRINSDTQITAMVNRGSTGPVAVTTPGGTAVSENSFTFYSTPRIASFSPRSGGTGSVITITGTGLSDVEYVAFGGTPALFNIISDREIEATLGSGSTGRITVSNPGGSSTSGATFTFYGIPSISSFSPDSGTRRTRVTIEGTNLYRATSVTFGGTNASTFYANSSGTTIIAVLGSGSTGPVCVTTPGGTVTSTEEFSYFSPPSIDSFTPTIGGTGSEVIITGDNFSGATDVKFGRTAAASFIVNSSTEIAAIVGDGSSGIIKVTTPGGTANSRASFKYVPAPVITAFTPDSAETGTSIMITGRYLTGATSVTFGGTPADSWQVYSTTRIKAVVGDGSTGVISVTTPGGTAVSDDVFTYTSIPAITSFDPVSARTLDTVIITGINLNGATQVKFGGTPAYSFNVNSSTEIAAVVGVGSTGKISVTTPGGTAESNGDFTYQPEGVKIVTLTDDDLPDPPIEGMTFHFLTPAEGDEGPAKIRIIYDNGLYMTYSVWLGVEDGKIWVSHFPQREAVPASLQAFYDELGIDPDEYMRYVFEELPPWLDISQYDPDLTGLPVVVGIATVDGQMLISYMEE
ncbi:MAG: IPT/TIG domain-containing protein [Dehalococcoidales bacterium]|nr:IPT/TIG domain-containing protein [Dehalococcoidales bacterium]